MGGGLWFEFQLELERQTVRSLVMTISTFSRFLKENVTIIRLSSVLPTRGLLLWGFSDIRAIAAMAWSELSTIVSSRAVESLRARDRGVRGSSGVSVLPIMLCGRME